MRTLSQDDESFDVFAKLEKKYGQDVAGQMPADPVEWVKKDLEIDLWSMQRVILRALAMGYPKIAVTSCNDSGKSFVSSLATACHIRRHPPRTARVITTAPGGQQVRGVLWNEINSLHAEHPDALPGRVNQTEWWLGNYMAGIGRKPADTGIEETFAGFHAENLLVVIDEAGGVTEELWTGVDTLATNDGAQILAIGNPTDPQSEFARICDGTFDNPGPAPGWLVLRIPAWKTPNFSGEPVTPKIRKVMLSQAWVDDKRVKWGEDDARWESRIEARFPTESSLSAIRKVDLMLAQAGLAQDKQAVIEDVQLGVDIGASDTGDETVIRERVGRRFLRRWTCRSSEPEVVADLIVRAARESGARMVHVDATGVGFGLLVDIRKRLPGVAVEPFIAAATPNDTKQFTNRRAEAYWTLREAGRRREIDLSQTENVDEVISQLTSVRYGTPKNKIQIEPKADIRKRLGRSPDDADALCLSLLPPADAVMPAPATVHAASRRRYAPSRAARPQRIAAGTTVPERVATPTTVPVKRSRGLRATHS